MAAAAAEGGGVSGRRRRGRRGGAGWLREVGVEGYLRGAREVIRRCSGGDQEVIRRGSGGDQEAIRREGQQDVFGRWRRFALGCAASAGAPARQRVDER
eukprot:6219807-Prymnesium_polylepis.1